MPSANAQQNTEKEVPSSPELKSKSKPPVRNESESPRPAKRKSADAQSPRPKKRKTKIDDSDDQSSPLSDVGSDTEPEVKPKRSTKTGKPSKTTAPKKKVKAAAADESDEPSGAANGSESEMSVVLDEEPKPKKKRGTKESEAKTKKPKASKPKASAEDDPDQAEIKRLQQWLVRCGIRKAWGIYLKPYETPKAKIKHLKEMLAEIGMTGRYSQEKAREIKEARELAADIEAVQEGEQRWGTGGKQSEDEDESQSRGRLVRGARAQYDFLSSDGEETS